MMDLESAIKHCIEVAEIQEVTARVSGGEPLQVKECLECATEHRQLAEWLRELRAYRDMQPLYLWYPLRKKVPEQYRHVIAILRCGSEVEVYLAHEMWHIVDGARTKFEDVVFWRYMEVNADEHE